MCTAKRLQVSSSVTVQLISQAMHATSISTSVPATMVGVGDRLCASIRSGDSAVLSARSSYTCRCHTLATLGEVPVIPSFEPSVNHPTTSMRMASAQLTSLRWQHQNANSSQRRPRQLNAAVPTVPSMQQCQLVTQPQTAPLWTA